MVGEGLTEIGKALPSHFQRSVPRRCIWFISPTNTPTKHHSQKSLKLTDAKTIFFIASTGLHFYDNVQKTVRRDGIYAGSEDKIYWKYKEKSCTICNERKLKSKLKNWLITRQARRRLNCGKLLETSGIWLVDLFSSGLSDDRARKAAFKIYREEKARRKAA